MPIERLTVDDIVSVDALCTSLEQHDNAIRGVSGKTLRALLDAYRAQIQFEAQKAAEAERAREDKENRKREGEEADRQPSGGMTYLGPMDDADCKLIQAFMMAFIKSRSKRKLT